MVNQHGPPKVPLGPRSGNEEKAGGPAGSPRKVVDLPFDEDWFEEGLSPVRHSQSQSQSQDYSQNYSQSQSQGLGSSKDQPIDLLERFDALKIGSQGASRADDSVVEIAPPPSGQGSARPSGLFGSKEKKQRPMSSAQQKAYNSVFVNQRTRPEHHRPPPAPANNAYRVGGPMNPVFADVKKEVKTYSSLDTFGPTAAGGYTTSGYGGEEFYTDPKQASADLKALLEGGMDEDEEGEKDESQGEHGRDGAIDGLNVRLLPHQVEGVDWMKGRELGPVKRGKVPRGGILADDMGLGKTLQSIALILTNQRPEKGDKGWKKSYEGVTGTTLVVAPLALIRQWEAEIKEKVTRSHRLKVCVHHGPQRTKSARDLTPYDVVVTTYQTLVSEHGSSSEGAEGPKTGCFGVHWWRVILDEAHTVKNRNAKATKACCALPSVFRWCLTGTPMQNNLDELQSLVHFLRIQPYDDLREWRAHIDKPMKGGRGHLALRRLHSLLRCFMKRRTKDILKEDGALNPGGRPDKEGQPSNGFKVTERKVVAVAAEFSAEERRFYDRLQQRADRTLEKMLKGKVNYANALVLLLRLRQVCNHPKLVEGKVEREADALGTVSGRGGKDITDGAVDDLADMLAGASIEVRSCSICGYELGGDEVRMGRETCRDCFEDLEYFNNHGGEVKPKSKGKKKKARKEKSSRAKAEQGHTTTEHSQSDAEPEESSQSTKPKRRGRNIVVDSDDEEEEGSWLVPEDQRGDLKLGRAGGEEDENCEGGGSWLGSEDSRAETETDGSVLDSFVVADERKEGLQLEGSQVEGSDDGFPSVAELCSQKTKADVSAASDSTANDASAVTADDTSGLTDSDSETETDASDDDELPVNPGKGPHVVPSAKIRQLTKILTKEARQHKFIVFSQFTSMLDLVEPFLRREGLGFARYDGGMRNDEREASLGRLRGDERTRVLLCSLKCGSLGLNLTAATRVVILEPFWNPVSPSPLSLSHFPFPLSAGHPHLTPLATNQKILTKTQFIEEQAIDRVHRLTQKTDVTVYKLTVAATVEERILQLQEKKRQLAEQAIEGGMKKNAFKLGIAEMLDLFKHGESKDFAGEYEAKEAGGRLLERRPAKREESEVFGRRW